MRARTAAIADAVLCLGGLLATGLGPGPRAEAEDATAQSVDEERALAGLRELQAGTTDSPAITRAMRLADHSSLTVRRALGASLRCHPVLAADHILRGLQSPSELDQRLAALAAAWSGVYDAEIADHLLRNLGSPSPVASVSYQAIELIRPLGEHVILSLRERVAGRDGRWRSALYNEIGESVRAGVVSPATVRELLSDLVVSPEAVRSRGVWVFIAACHADVRATRIVDRLLLGLLGTQLSARESVEVVEQLAEGPSWLEDDAVTFLRALASRQPALAEAAAESIRRRTSSAELSRTLSGEGDQLKLAALRRLAASPPMPEAVEPIVRSLIRSDRVSVAIAACAAMLASSPADPLASTELARLATAQEEASSVEFLGACRLAIPTAQLEQYVKGSLEHESAEVRMVAVAVVAAWATRTKDYAGWVTPAFEDPEPLLRIAASEVHLRAGLQADRAIAMLRASLDDPDPRWRAAAAQAIANVGAPARELLPSVEARLRVAVPIERRALMSAWRRLESR